ncbi:MAG: ABC transporter ATP-binding protein, partial [Microbacterium sp.]
MSGAEQNSRKQARAERIAQARAGRGGAVAETAAPLTEEEKAEQEQAEKARQHGGGMFDGPAPGKADHFWPSFKRMIGLLKPSALWFVLVSVFGA